MEPTQDETVKALEDFETSIRTGHTFTTKERQAFAEALKDLTGGRKPAVRLIRSHMPTQL